MDNALHDKLAKQVEEPCEGLRHHLWLTTEHGHDICEQCKRTRPTIKSMNKQTKDARAAFEAWKRMPGQNVTPGEAWFAAVKWARQP